MRDNSVHLADIGTAGRLDKGEGGRWRCMGDGLLGDDA
jgi:hypothetical protein